MATQELPAPPSPIPPSPMYASSEWQRLFRTFQSHLLASPLTTTALTRWFGQAPTVDVTSKLTTGPFRKQQRQVQLRYGEHLVATATASVELDALPLWAQQRLSTTNDPLGSVLQNAGAHRENHAHRPLYDQLEPPADFSTPILVSAGTFYTDDDPSHPHVLVAEVEETFTAHALILKGAASSAPTEAFQESIEQAKALQAEIERIDHKVVSLLSKRLGVAQQLRNTRTAAGPTPVYKPEEVVLLDHLRRHLGHRYSRELYAAILHLQ